MMECVCWLALWVRCSKAAAVLKESLANMMCDVQATKLPTAILSTTKKAKDRAKRKAEAKAGKLDASTASSTPTAAAAAAKAAGTSSSLGIAGTSSSNNGALAPTQAANGKTAEASASKDDAHAGGSSTEMNGTAIEKDDDQCPFTLENPCR
jgi:hypothetical protein